MVSTIIAENFLSWKKLHFDVDTGVTLIDGWNDDDQTAEGSGKSAVFNALSWCLYGKIPKDAKMDDVIKHGEKSCMVSVLFDDGVMVTRSRKPNHLFLTENGNFENQIKGKDAKETQKLIEDYIGLSFDAFCQSVYFAQNNMKKFLSANQEERGKILSEIQDLNAFDKARKEVMGLLKIAEPNIVEIQHQIQMERKNLEMIQNQIQHEKSMFDQLKTQKEQQLNSIRFDLNTLSDKLKENKSKQKAISEQMSKITVVEESQIKVEEEKKDPLRNEMFQLQMNMKNIDDKKLEYQRKESEGKRYAEQYKTLQTKCNELQAFIDNPTKNCPTCGSLLEKCDTTHATQELQKNQIEMQEIVKTLESISVELSEIKIGDPTQINQRLSEINKEIYVIDDVINTIKTNIRMRNELSMQLSQLAGQEDQIENSIDETLKKFNDLEAAPIEYDEGNLKLAEQSEFETQSKITSLIAVLEESQSHVNRLNDLKSGYKEVKSFIFNSVLAEINARAARYLERLFEVPVSMKFTNDNMKIDVEVTINGEPRGLGLLSGGQFRRVCLAVDMALSDVVLSRKGSKLNIMILDEYFKDLSEQSMEKCLALLEGRGHPVLLIEHNSIFKNIVDSTFFVRYEKGTSFIQT